MLPAVTQRDPMRALGGSGKQWATYGALRAQKSSSEGKVADYWFSGFTRDDVFANRFPFSFQAN